MREIEMEENLPKDDGIFKYSQHLNIKDFNRIIIKGDRNFSKDHSNLNRIIR